MKPSDEFQIYISRMKWRGTEPVEGRLDTELPDKMIEWAHQHGKIVRGHALLWAKRHSLYIRTVSC